MVDVGVIPDLYQFATLRGSIEEFEGLPIINLKDQPMQGWNAIGKRITDFGLSLLLLDITRDVSGHSDQRPSNSISSSSFNR